MLTIQLYFSFRPTMDIFTDKFRQPSDSKPWPKVIWCPTDRGEWGITPVVDAPLETSAPEWFPPPYILMPEARGQRIRGSTGMYGTVSQWSSQSARCYLTCPISAVRRLGDTRVYVLSVIWYSRGSVIVAWSRYHTTPPFIHSSQSVIHSVINSSNENSIS